MKILTILTALIFSGIATAAAQEAEKENPWLKTAYEKVLKQPECMIEHSRADFLEFLKSLGEKIEKGMPDGSPLKATQYRNFASIIRTWLQFKYFECDTNISKEWLNKIAGIFEKMFEYNRAMDHYERHKNNKEFDKYHKAFNDLLDLYRKEIQNPERPARQIRERLEVQKIQERRAYQEYLRRQRREKGGGGSGVFAED